MKHKKTRQWTPTLITEKKHTVKIRLITDLTDLNGYDHPRSKTGTWKSLQLQDLEHKFTIMDIKDYFHHLQFH